MISIITTADGSSSLFVQELNETYHSRHGAMAESTHIYINAGLKYLLQSGAKQINIFEMGFGTGLNAILTYKEWQQHIGLTINYTAIEKYPVGVDIFTKLVYNGVTDNDEIAQRFNVLHTAGWGVEFELAEGFKVLKIADDIREYDFENNYHLIYYDAFAPSKQPDVWAVEVLKKVCRNIEKNGVLITYCANGEFKRTLKQLGVTVETLQGPVGKKQITRGVKI